MIIVSREGVLEKAQRGVEKFRNDKALSALEMEPKLELCASQLYILANVHELKYILEVSVTNKKK